MKQYPNMEDIPVPRFCEEAGFYTTTKRSEMMSKIRSKNTKPENKLRKALWGMGIRYRINVKSLPGSPDLVIKKYRLAVFVDGEFWHGYNWKEKKQAIKRNRAFWIPKIERNILRDKQNNEKLRNQGYTVFRFWEQEIKKEFGACINQILQHIETCKHNP